jgi:hypothetical protein
MANPIQFASSNPNKPSIKFSNFYIGTRGGYGPTTSTNFYSGLSPGSAKFVVYLNKASDGPSIRSIDESSAEGFLKSLGYQTNPNKSYAQVFQTASFSDDICLVNKNLEKIISSDIKFHLDAGFTPCLVSSSEYIYPGGQLSPNSFSSGSLLPDSTSGSRYSTDNGGYVEFGSSDYIKTDFTSPQSFTSPFNLSFWTYLSGSQSSGTRLFSKRSTSSNGFEIYIDGNKVKLSFLGTQTLDFTAAGNLNVNDWNYISVNFGSTAAKVSLNNGSERSVNYSFGTGLSNITSTQPVLLGTSDGSGNFLRGGISVVSMYGSELSSDEIDINYGVLKTRFGLT